MRKQRDLQVCVTLIRAVLTRGGLEPEQRNALENALGSIKELQRPPGTNRLKTYEVVRRITEELVNTFVKRK
jgi:hypothetical protein